MGGGFVAAAGGVGDWGGAGGGAEGPAGEGSESMLRVLVGQRDRLRAKVQELEVALAGTRSEAAAAQQQLAAARADNVALIERLRYVGGYRQQMAAARHSEGANVEAGSGADVVGKYSQLYDEGMNPFKEFQVGLGRQSSVCAGGWCRTGDMRFQCLTGEALVEAGMCAVLCAGVCAPGPDMLCTGAVAARLWPCVADAHAVLLVVLLCSATRSASR